jgi:hypothetical protein
MAKPLLNRRRRRTAGLWLLALLIFRAYIPVGFMPASGTPFALELCPVGLAGMPAAHVHQHSGTHADFATCPFGSAPAAGPVSHDIAFEPPVLALSRTVAAPQSPILTLRPQRSHLPRGPPSLV